MPASTVIERRRRERNNNILQFPDDLGAHAMLLLFRKYEYIKPGERRLNRVTDETLSRSNLSGMDNIMLPLPTNIADRYSVRVQRFDQEFKGEIVSAGAAGLSGLSGNVGGQGADATLGQLAGVAFDALPMPDLNALMSLDIASLSKDAAFLARRTIDKQFSGLSRNLDAGFGNTINPKAALYFDGVEMKTHTFNWTFVPRSESESNGIRDIGNTIKKNILPSYGNVRGVNRVLLNYPSTVDIFFFGVDQSYFMYYKTCMVQQFDIDFTPQGLAFVKGGRPAMVTMSMNVIETDIHTSEDYGGESSYDSGQTADDVQNVLADRARGIARGF
jgi:hypothetical protein